MYCRKFQNTHTFKYQKTLLHTFLLLAFKVVESFQCFLNDSINVYSKEWTIIINSCAKKGLLPHERKMDNFVYSWNFYKHEKNQSFYTL